MAEHLSTSPVIEKNVAIYPRGIEANPGPNGVTPTKTADYIGSVVATACLNDTPVTTELGQEAYSELQIEGFLEQRARELSENRYQQEEVALTNIALASGDQTRRSAATRTLALEIDSDLRDKYYDNQRTIEELEALGKKGLTPPMRANLSKLKREQRLIERRNSSSTRAKSIRGFFRRRDDLKARKGGELIGVGEAQLSALLEDRGNHRGLRHSRFNKQIEKRGLSEDEQIRNIVGRKGVVVQLEANRRYVVSDILPTPAQGFKVIGTAPDGKPIFETDRRGQCVLHDLYLPEIDEKTGRPKIDHSTGKIVIKEARNPLTGRLEKVTAPRDDPHLRTGHDKTSGEITTKGPFFYEDGSSVHSQAVSGDSFKPTDDRVVLKPLLSGAEAIRVLVEGRDSGISLKDKHVTVGALSDFAQRNPQTVVSDEARIELLENHLVFSKSDRHTNPNLRPDYDITKRTGHFERFSYTDPVTTRQHRIFQQTELYGVERVKKARKKGYKVRDTRLSS